jgi:hypothetical protein
MGRFLPRIQLASAVIFTATSLCGPLFFAQGNRVIAFSALAGILLGAATFFIGWRLVVDKSSVSYPFPEWSMGIIKLFLDPKQARGLKPFSHELSPFARQVLGIASLAVGALLVVGLFVVFILVLSA